MNEIEYDIIDELYFVTSFPDIKNTLLFSDEELCQNLLALIKKGYLKAFYPDPDSEVEFSDQHFSQDFHQYFFLATKAGLIAHNSR